MFPVVIISVLQSCSGIIVLDVDFPGMSVSQNVITKRPGADLEFEFLLFDHLRVVFVS